MTRLFRKRVDEEKRDEITGLAHLEESAGWRLLPPMPIAVSCFREHADPRMYLKDGEAVFDFVRRSRPQNVTEMIANYAANAPVILNTRRLRGDFLDVRTAEEALRLFERTGAFRKDRQREGTEEAIPLTWTELQGWQQIIRARMLYGPQRLSITPTCKDSNSPGFRKVPCVHNPVSVDFLNSIALDEEKAWLQDWKDDAHLFKTGGVEQRQLKVQIAADSFLEGMLAECHIDSLTETKYGLCALPECINLFEITSKQPRHYCSNAHAHRAAVRRKSAEAREGHGAIDHANQGFGRPEPA